MGKHPPRPATKPRPTEQGRWLTEMRMKYGRRQSDIAQIFDIHPGRICEWEQGIHPIPDLAMRELRAYFQRLETVMVDKKKRRRRLM